MSPAASIVPMTLLQKLWSLVRLPIPYEWLWTREMLWETPSLHRLPVDVAPRRIPMVFAMLSTATITVMQGTLQMTCAGPLVISQAKSYLKFRATFVLKVTLSHPTGLLGRVIMSSQMDTVKYTVVLATDSRI